MSWLVSPICPVLSRRVRILRTRVVPLVVLSILVAGGIALAAAPRRARWLVCLGLATASVPVAEAWRAARGTALRAAVFWAGLAISFCLVSQAAAWVEPLEAGRPLAGHLV